MLRIRRAVVVLGLLYGGALASAADAAPSGSLVRLPETLGCLSEQELRDPGCSYARIGRGVTDTEVSPDGRHVYVATRYTIWTFLREPTTGALQRIRGRRGCIRHRSRTAHCGRALGMSGVQGIALSPDGRNVYAAAQSSKSVAILRRNATTGRLRQDRGRRGCISEFRGPCGRASGSFRGPVAVAISSDGRNVYVASSTSVGPGDGGVAVFARTRRDGLLRQATGSGGCLSDRGDEDCGPARAIAGAGAITVTPDGRSVYVAGRSSLAVFARRRHGRLKQLRGEHGCIMPRNRRRVRARLQCAAARRLASPDSFAVSPDSRSLYVPQIGGVDRVLVFGRRHDGSIRQLAGADGCVESGGGPCVSARGFSLPLRGTVSPDGRNVYFGTEGGMAVFRRQASGALRQLGGPFGCDDWFPGEGCRQIDLLADDSRSVAISADGRNVYMGSNWLIEVFRRTP